MAKLIRVPLWLVEDLGMRIKPVIYDHVSDVSHYDRRGFARRARRIFRQQRRQMAATAARRRQTGLPTHLTDWWLMARKALRKYGVRA